MPKLFGGKRKLKTIELKANIKLKVPQNEYELINESWKKAIFIFEQDIKSYIDKGKLSPSVYDKIAKGLNLETYRAEGIKSPEALTAIFATGLQKAKTKTPSPTKPEPAIQSPPATQPKPTAPPIRTPTTSTPPSTPSSTPPPSSPTPTISPSAMEAQPKPISTPTPTAPTTPKPAAPSISVPKVPSPSTTPDKKPEIKVPSVPSVVPTPTPPPISTPKVTTTSPNSPTSIGAANSVLSKLSGQEEDRATGIAILRRQMLDELKKIRTSVGESKT